MNGIDPDHHCVMRATQLVHACTGFWTSDPLGRSSSRGDTAVEGDRELECKKAPLLRNVLRPRQNQLATLRFEATRRDSNTRRLQPLESIPGHGRIGIAATNDDAGNLCL